MSSSILALREKLKELQLDALIVENSDAHQSEYVPECDLRRTFISGFTGSAGTALVCLSDALLWTDGRYFLQAVEELSSEWTLMRMGMEGVPTISKWLSTNLVSGMSVGVDQSLISTDRARSLVKDLEPFGIKIIPLSTNPIDSLWSNRPAPAFSVVKVHQLSFAGVSHKDKINNVQKFLTDVGAVAVIVSMLDEVAWLLNIRGSDVTYNPVVVAYVVVTTTNTHLFINKNKLDENALQHLADTVTVHEYEEVDTFVASQAELGRVVADPAQVNWRLYGVLGQAAMEKPSPIILPKALKNETELVGFRDCHVRDGAALTAFLHWLENAVTDPSAAPVTEFDVSVKIEEFRAKDPRHISPSFATIAGYGSNGAVIHYKPHKETALVLGCELPFLLDSGAQYLDGTTDVTRTVHFGTPTSWHRECFTRVLQGHIKLARAVFPEGTLGSRMDMLARMSLWEAGLDYNHGTGHGVGAFLNVHEGPQGISHRTRADEVGFKVSMTVSNEPGYYEDGAFGIRIENLCVTVSANTPHNFNGKTYCAFETVTLAPLERKLIAVELLSDIELDWVNEYHKRVREKVSPVMQERFPESLDYLLRHTEPIVRA